MLGVIDDPEIEQRTTVLYPGDMLLLYTDGVTEAISPQGVEFGVENLEAAMRAAAEQPSEQVILSVAQTQQAFTGGNEQYDDFTLLVLRREPVAQRTATDAAS